MFSSVAQEPSKFINMSLYEKLPQGSFRLIRLLPDRERIAIGLSSFPLSEKIPAFEALSYAWGTEAFTEHISCTTDPSDRRESIETLLSVSSHLYEGLRCLRATSEGARPRWLWIDAICIDQKDCEEKSIQVPLMSEIYSRAQGVIVWLGRADENTINVMKIIPELTRKMKEIKDLQGVNYKTARYVHINSQML